MNFELKNSLMKQIRCNKIAFKSTLILIASSTLIALIDWPVKVMHSTAFSCCPQNATGGIETSIVVPMLPLSSPAMVAVSNGQGCSLNYMEDNFQSFQASNPTSPGPSASLNSIHNQQVSSVNLIQAAAPTNLALIQQQQPQQASSTSVGLECQYITADQLHDKFNRIRPTGLRVTSLIIRDSNLTALSNLPQGFHELKRLSISNTSIDLEVLKEGSESLDQLTILEITNEKISNIPRNFFEEMQSLRELRLENDGIASLDGDAFYNLDDSLEVLNLRLNRFNRFPMAVKNLAQLAVLDLSDNDIVIDTQESDLPEKLEPLLNLRELVMNRINCTCEFSSSPFFEWIARTHISGVRCFAPDKFVSKEVIVFERDEFCANSLAHPTLLQSRYQLIFTLISSLIITQRLRLRHRTYLSESHL